MEVNDGNTTFSGGQNDGLLGDRIAPDQYAKGINVTTNSGYLSPRPGMIFQDIKVITEGGVDDLSYEEIFLNGKIQAAAPYVTNQGKVGIVVISGVIFEVIFNRLEAHVLKLPNNERLNQYKRKINWSEAGKFLVLYDYPDAPIIIEPSSLARRANRDRLTSLGTPQPEVPVSELGAYNMNRLFVAQGTEFGAGDPVGSLASEDAPITFEESLVSAQAYNGQFFSLGSSSRNKNITAMTFLQTIDTGTGIGPLIVANEESVYTYRTDLPRRSWEAESFGALALYGSGIAGARALTNLNSDLLFFSPDNQMRSFSMSRSKVSRWNDTPISREIDGWLKDNDLDLLDLAVVQGWRNKILLTVRPYITRALSTKGREIPDYAFRGLAVLELDNVSTLRSQGSPAWAGLWTGIDPRELITIGNDLYILGKENGRINRFYKLDINAKQDYTPRRNYKDIKSRIYTRTYDFQDRFLDKREKNIDFSLSGIEGCFQMDVFRRPSEDFTFARWKTWNHNAKTGIVEGQKTMDVLEKQSFPEANLGSPDEVSCHPGTKDSAELVRKIQFRLDITGRAWKLEEIRLKFEAELPGDRQNIDCCSSAEIKKDLTGVSDLDFYRI